MVKENKFYPCLWCGTTEKSIQTFFCSKHEVEIDSEIKSKYVELARTGMDKLNEYKEHLKWTLYGEYNKERKQSNGTTNKDK